MNQRQIFKNENIPMTQIKPENNWNLLNENFQSFGTDLITFINNDLNPIKNIDNKNEITSIKLETIKENNRFYICKNKYENTKNYDYEYNLEKYKSLLEENKNNETERLRTKLQETNKIYNDKYISTTVNNTENRTYSYFNIKKIENNNGNKNHNIQNGSNIIDFNELEQFSPPSYKLGINL